MIGLVWAALIAMALWHLFAGMRTGTMSALGQVYATAEKTRHPVRFWFFGGFNLLMLLTGILLLGSEFSA